MAVARLSKLFIISHKSDTGSVLKKLQKTSIPIEIRPYTEEINLEIPDSGVDTEQTTRVKKALEILASIKEKKLKKAVSRAGKLVVKRNEYEKILRNEKFEEIVDKILEIEREIETLEDKIAD